MERQQKEWSEFKHLPSKRTDVKNMIRSILEKKLIIPAELKKPLINLGLGKNNLNNKIIGEPSRANGFELPPVINEAMVEAI